MTVELRLDRDLVPLAVLQKTRMQHPLSKVFGKLGLSSFYAKYGVRYFEPLRRLTIEREFSERSRKQFEDIKLHIPKTVQNILDIGCGLGGVDIFLGRHYSALDPHFYLLDVDGISDKIEYSFKEKASHYTSLASTRRFLIANGLRDDHIHTIDIGRQSFPEGIQFDLVISLISWGFHYPVGTYLDQVVKSLSPEGVVILDVRRASGGLELISSRFTDIAVVAETAAWQKVKAAQRRQ